jgi:hypothetical protein
VGELQPDSWKSNSEIHLPMRQLQNRQILRSCGDSRVFGADRLAIDRRGCTQFRAVPLAGDIPGSTASFGAIQFRSHIFSVLHPDNGVRRASQVCSPQSAEFCAELGRTLTRTHIDFLASFDCHIAGLPLLGRNGEIFGAVGIVLSLAGLFYSTIALQDLRHVINNFEDFAVRLKSMVEEVARENSDDHYLRIMAYMPLPGAVALAPKEYRRLRDAILQEKARIELVCLDSEDSREWNLRFTGKRIRGGQYADAAFIEGVLNDYEDTIKRIATPALGEVREWASHHPVMRGKIGDLPRFFAYFTNERALVVNMLYHVLDSRTANDQPRDLMDNVTEVIGFETTDTYTIKNISKLYDAVRLGLQQPN